MSEFIWELQFADLKAKKNNYRPCPGNERTTQELIGTLPPDPRHYKRERAQVACARVTAHSSPSSRCSLRSRLSLSASALHSTTQEGTSPPKMPATLRRRQPPRRILPRFGSRLDLANRLLLPGKQPPHPRCGHGSCRGVFHKVFFSGAAFGRVGQEEERGTALFPIHRQHHRRPTR